MIEEYSCKVEYDSEFDLLALRRLGMHATSGIAAGPFTIALDKHGLVGIEIEDTKDVLESLFGFKLSLDKITKGKIGFKEEKNMMLIYFSLNYENKELKKEVVVPKITAMPIMTKA